MWLIELDGRVSGLFDCILLVLNSFSFLLFFFLFLKNFSEFYCNLISLDISLF